MNFWLYFTKKKFLAVLILSCSLFAFGIQDYSRQEAQKVLRVISKIERESARKTDGSLENISITESELNSYIAYRIEVEKEKIMKELRAKLFKRNKIEGKILIDLSGQQIPSFLKPQMTLYFGGRLEVKGSQVRLVLKDLFLEDQRIDPNVLDLIIALAAKIENYKVWSINDWFDLPYGIKDVRTQNQKAVFYY
ncbi:MAG: hypothetical protein OEY25_03255 [Candidatus Aminicenantes bacterium]|nr:hypothetical protein [Candidatus Aminicenantes bacterium]MDH5704816.1 hypothetical protein [Candidatus Aminicenantes bacterium]